MMKNLTALKKISITIVLFLMFIIFSRLTVNAGESYSIIPCEINNIKNDIIVKGNLPVVSIENSEELESNINSIIETEFENVLKKSNVHKGEVVFSYDEYFHGYYISLVLNCWNGNNLDAVGSVNFSSETFSVVTINDVLGVNGTKMLNKALANEINSDLDKYNANFIGIDENHMFYAENGVITVIFDKYEIANGRAGIVCFPFYTNKVVELALTNDDYKIKIDYSLKMVMLKQVSQFFNMTLGWDESSSSVVIYSSDKQKLAEITIGSNNYSRVGSTSPIYLESAPEIFDDRTYVPVSFFESILGISYNINQTGLITFSKYAE